MKLNDMRVSHKLWGTIFGLLVAMLLAAGWTQMRLRQVAADNHQRVAQYQESITRATQWRALVGMELGMNTDSITTTDEALRQDFATRAADLTTRINPLQAAAQKAATTPEDKAALAAIAAARADILGQAAKVNALTTPNVPNAVDTPNALDASDVPNAEVHTTANKSFVDTEYRPRAQTYLAAIDKFLALQMAARDAARQTAGQTSDRVLWEGLASALLVLGLGAVLALLLVRSITQPLARAIAVSNAIAAGDLALQAHDSRKDEFGQLLRSLGAMLGQLRGRVGEVRTGNHDLLDGIAPTASDVPQAAARLEPLASPVAPLPDTARQGFKLSCLLPRPVALRPTAPPTRLPSLATRIPAKPPASGPRRPVALRGTKPIQPAEPAKLGQADREIF